MRVGIGQHRCPLCGEEYTIKNFHGDKMIVSSCDGSANEVQEDKKCFLFCQDGIILTKKDLR